MNIIITLSPWTPLPFLRNTFWQNSLVFFLCFVVVVVYPCSKILLISSSPEWEQLLVVLVKREIEFKTKTFFVVILHNKASPRDYGCRKCQIKRLLSKEKNTGILRLWLSTYEEREVAFSVLKDHSLLVMHCKGRAWPKVFCCSISNKDGQEWFF